MRTRLGQPLWPVLSCPCMAGPKASTEVKVVKFGRCEPLISTVVPFTSTFEIELS